VGLIDRKEPLVTGIGKNSVPVPVVNMATVSLDILDLPFISVSEITCTEG